MTKTERLNRAQAAYDKAKDVWYKAAQACENALPWNGCRAKGTGVCSPDNCPLTKGK